MSDHEYRPPAWLSLMLSLLVVLALAGSLRSCAGYIEEAPRP